MQNIYAFGIPVQWSVSWGVASKADGRLSTISRRPTVYGVALEPLHLRLLPKALLVQCLGERGRLARSAHPALQSLGIPRGLRRGTIQR
jgi:hypothetical protein